MVVEWSHISLRDRDEIFDYIVADNASAAQEIDLKIEGDVDSLLDHPHRGRPGRVAGTRELVIANTPYIVAYKIDRTTIRVLRVIHGARRWPASL